MPQGPQVCVQPKTSSIKDSFITYMWAMKLLPFLDVPLGLGRCYDYMSHE